MGTARLVKKLGGFRGDARLYAVTPPLDGNAYVVVSAVPAAFDTGRPETYIFGANSTGTIASFAELAGSFRGEQNHDKALSNAGYVVCPR